MEIPYLHSLSWVYSSETELLYSEESGMYTSQCHLSLISASHKRPGNITKILHSFYSRFPQVSGDFPPFHCGVFGQFPKISIFEYVENMTIILQLWSKPQFSQSGVRQVMVILWRPWFWAAFPTCTI